MLTLLLTIGILYLALWLVINTVGIILKVAFYPIRLIVGIVFGIIAVAFLTPLTLFLVIPAFILLILWAIGKLVAL